MSNARTLALDGVWRNNPALVQLLGLCPLLAVSQTLVTSLTLGLITLAVLVGANTLISLLKRTLVDTVRLPLQILVIATMVSAADLLMQTYFFELYQRIGLFIALIVTNCTIFPNGSESPSIATFSKSEQNTVETYESNKWKSKCGICKN